jgi:uncharacterized phage protein gp47/JayE
MQIASMSVDSTVLPYVIQADQSYTRLEVTAYGSTAINDSPSSPSSSGSVSFSGTVGIDLPGGDALLVFVARNYDPAQMGWPGSSASPAVSFTPPVGYSFVDDNGYVQEALAVSGPTGLTEPPVFTASGVAYDNVFQVTAVSVASDQVTLTVKAVNTLVQGDRVAFLRLLLASWLNGTIVTVLSASSSQFTAILPTPYTYTQAAGTVESGIAGIVTQDNGVVWGNTGYYEVSPTVQFTVIPYISGSSVVIGPPSGVNSYKSQVACRVEWLMPSFPGTIGTKVMLSTDPAGVNPPYVQYGDIVPVSQVSRVSTAVLSSDSTTNYNPQTGVQVVTTTNQTQEFTFNYVDIPPSAVNNATQFYAMLSTVVQDPNTSAVYESQQNGPLTCGFVNLALASPTDFLALQRKEDIAGRMISYITQLYPDLDLSPRSEARDLLIDPVSIELANMSVREWFDRCSRSVSAISQVDNASGNGISDDFNSSPVKQQIARAFGLNATDTQSLIDRQFDVLGETAGLTRGGSTGSVVTLTFYTYTQPAQTATFPAGILCSTTADSVTPALTFITTGSASITPGSAPSFYDPAYGWWAVSIPASCQTTGSSTNVGAGTVNTISSGAPAGWAVTNLVSATFGQDEEVNSKFASRIAAREITGVDSGTRNGYYTTAMATPGIVATTVVAAGDIEMVRDWDPIRQKHVYGCVDIYCQGVSSSENDQDVAFEYGNTGTPGQYTTYLPLTVSSATSTLLRLYTGQQPPQWPLYQGVELLVTGASGSFFLDVEGAQFDNANGYIILDPSGTPYRYVGSGATLAKVPVVNSTVTPPVSMTNLAAVQAASQASATFMLCARMESPLSCTPSQQPVTAADSVIGPLTGTIPTAQVEAVHTSDFLLYGGSNEAGDEVQVSSSYSAPVTKTVTASLSQPVLIDTGMDIPVGSAYNSSSDVLCIGNVLSVRSLDLSTLYAFGQDYAITASGPYHTYSLMALTSSPAISSISLANNILTVGCDNSFGTGAPVTLGGLTNATFLDGQQVAVSASTGNAFTAYYPYSGTYGPAADTGNATGSAIQDQQQVVVSYNQFTVYERLSLASGEAQTLSGSTPAALDNQGFVHNTWLPESYGRNDLTLDGWDSGYTYDAEGNITGLDVAGSTGLVGAGIPHDSRYIKVTIAQGGEVLQENVDFTLSVDPVSGAASITRLPILPDGTQVLVSYFYTEAFDFATEYPSFVPVLASQVATFKHAAADVLVKAMVANPVDVTLTVTLAQGQSPDALDPVIRTAIDEALDNAQGTLYQSEIVSQVQAVEGVQSVGIPLIKCAKSDGSYDIGFVIPTGTAWTALGSDPAFAPLKQVTLPGGSTVSYIPANSFITSQPVLPDSTVPSGGPLNAFVGLLYQGQPYARASSIQGFLASAVTPQAASGNGSFYIVGTGDQVFVPSYNGTSDYSLPLGPSYPQRVIITAPLDIASPSLLSYFVTYQVWGEGSAKDITLSSTEYFTAGRVTINYVTGS